MKVIGIAGMPGCGKSDAADVARSMGIPVIVMGDIIRKEVTDSGHEIGQGTLRRMMVELREKFGKGIVAERCLPLIRALSSHRAVLVDGIRSLDEVKVFRREFKDFFLIAIHSSPRVRYGRLHERHRKDDPHTWEQFCERDKIELSVDIGDAIALADTVISNDGAQHEFRRNVRQLLLKVLARKLPPS